MREKIHVNFVTNKSSKRRVSPIPLLLKKIVKVLIKKVPSTLFNVIAPRGRILSARTFAVLHGIENEWNPNISILTTSA